MKKAIVALVAVGLAVGMASMAVAQESESASGGDVVQNDVSDTSETNTWAGFYGTVTVDRQLSDGTDNMFEWTSEDASGSVIYAVEGSTADPSEATLAEVTDLTEGGNADTITGTSGREAASEVYPGVQAAPDTGNVDSLGDTAALDTYDSVDSASAFTSFLAEDTDTTNPVFFGNIEDAEEGFDGGDYDYQLLATTGDDMSNDTFDFYLEVG